ncbi:cancer-associated gene 1 protein homolog isoform X3 [Rattus norvegicus]|uniref:Cancer antigen 1 n=1 Tax=Rattus norvegicus TaxID=10116 RepID=A0A8I5Y609_RAT|nr:cancer-associated gene 1 protein homolog isoform X3 [Rattus norvegicus]XP_006253873.1 cancer-associated gene 1 protein homolog isoform X3 [Rattus norvegicus]|eukprot:XP_006253872.1 PREDICTED: cancer-associated gene 1 protein homolog isoform X3 [Rattus norvegicus]
MSETETMNVNGPQDFYSDSPFCLEASFSSSDLLQNETKNVKRGNESVHMSSEDILSTEGSLLGDINLGNYPERIQNQPANTRVSSSRQFEPICKFHWIDAFNDDSSVPDLTRAFSYSEEKPELQSQVYNDPADASQKPDPLKEESLMESSTSENKDELVHEPVRKSRSLCLNHYRGKTRPLTETPLVRSVVVDVALNNNQPESFLGKENVCRNGENLSDSENCFDQLDLRAIYKAGKPEVSSKGIQNSGEFSDMSVGPQEEVTEDGLDSLAITSPWSPAGIFKGRRSQDDFQMPDGELDFESLEPLEEDMALNEALQKLKQTNKKQELQIQDLHGRNLTLESRVQELQTKVSKQHVLLDIINKLKVNVEELIDDKYNVILEKNDINKKLQDLQETSANTKKHLQESKKDQESLQLQVKKIKVHYVRLQERYIAEIQQKNRSVTQCLEIEKTLSKKDEELQRLQRHKGELEKATSSALDLLKREKEIREQEFLSFQEEFQRREKENLKERRKLKSRVEKLVAQVKSLLFTCESERAQTTALQQQVDALRLENLELRQQAAKREAQACTPSFEIIQPKEKLEEVVEPDVTQDLAIPDTELRQESKKANDIMLQRLKDCQLRKKDLDKELLKHRNRIATLKELIANEKALQDHTMEITDFDTEEVKNASEAPVLLTVKLDKYHSLNEELDFLITKLGDLLESKEDHYSRLIEENDKYRRHVGSLINKVTSYEEIIKCADQRLEISHSQIAHLEERNRHLEDLIRMPREKARGLRPRLDNHPKSMTLISHLEGHHKECSISM